jgi:flagellar motor switch protein FliM
MTPRDLVTLRPGDIVPLEHPVTAPLTVSSAGVTFAHAVAGSSGNRLACLVVPPPKED